MKQVSSSDQGTHIAEKKAILCVFSLSVIAVFLITLCIAGTSDASVAEEDSDTGLIYTIYEDEGEVAITGYTGSGGFLEIPDELEGYPVTSINYNAFYQCNSLTSVTIPGTVKVIKINAFGLCKNLESVVLSDGIAEIRDDAFNGCISLKSVTIPGTVKDVGNSAFFNCISLSSVTISNGVERIGDNVFAICAASSIVIPDSVTSIGEISFAFCQYLTSVTIGKGVESIGDRAFFTSPNLSTVFFKGKNCPELGEDVFSGTSEDLKIIVPSECSDNYSKWCDADIVEMSKSDLLMKVSRDSGTKDSEYYDVLIAGVSAGIIASIILIGGAAYIVRKK